MWIFRKAGGIICPGPSIPDGADAIDAEDLYEAHVATCPVCGKRVPENLTGELATMIRSSTLGMFAPLAVAEALVTYSLGIAIIPVTRSQAELALFFTLGAVAVFFAVQLLALTTLLRRFALPVISPSYFRSPVVEILARERKWTLAAFIIRYVQFTRVATTMTFWTYAAAAVVVAWIFQSFIAGGAIAMSGIAWAISFRARLGVVQPIGLLDVDHIEREELYRLQAKHSRAYRFLSLTLVLDAALAVHTTMIVCVSGAALLGHLLQGSAHFGNIGSWALIGAAVALIQYRKWNRLQKSGADKCQLIPQIVKHI